MELRTTLKTTSDRERLDKNISGLRRKTMIVIVSDVRQIYFFSGIQNSFPGQYVCIQTSKIKPSVINLVI